MTSILTNTAAMSSLQALTATQRQLSTTQSQISSGLSVAKASDNAAYWSIATTMRAQVAGLDAVNKGLSLTLAIADVTGAALGSIKTSLDRIQADVVAAQQSGVSLSAVQLDISAQQQSILAVANAASFNGVNWLTNKISTSQTVNIKVVADPDEIDYAKIALGQEQGISTFDSTITQTFTQSESGVSTSETTTSGYHITRTAAEDGTVTTDKEPKTPTDSGSSAILHVGDVIVPMSVTSSGSLTKSSFSLELLPFKLGRIHRSRQRRCSCGTHRV